MRCSSHGCAAGDGSTQGYNNNYNVKTMYTGPPLWSLPPSSLLILLTSLFLPIFRSSAHHSCPLTHSTDPPPSFHLDSPSIPLVPLPSPPHPSSIHLSTMLLTTYPPLPLSRPSLNPRRGSVTVQTTTITAVPPSLPPSLPPRSLQT